VTYDAVVFDLLTGLIDSWTLWNEVAGSPDDGLRWRRRYLELTYGCGAYRPYELLMREAAHDAGLPVGLADELERRWDELQAWPEARRVLAALPVPLAGRHQLLAAARRRTCQGPRRSACRSTGTTASACRRTTDRGRIISPRRSTSSPICFRRAKVRPPAEGRRMRGNGRVQA
jgi:hypothetical protein